MDVLSKKPRLHGSQARVEALIAGRRGAGEYWNVHCSRESMDYNKLGFRES